VTNNATKNATSSARGLAKVILVRSGVLGIACQRGLVRVVPTTPESSPDFGFSTCDLDRCCFDRVTELVPGSAASNQGEGHLATEIRDRKYGPWLDWVGGAPDILTKKTPVTIRQRNGREFDTDAPHSWKGWIHFGDEFDIVAFRQIL